ncbi:hypothetical protein BCA37_11060 [Mycobacterium sp. djl-10]|nr:hypothetical protein BCA37_11060 [Mycobacterium sp. djl-10]
MQRRGPQQQMPSQPIIVQQMAPAQTVYVGGGTSHGLHLLLTLLTCGLWLPVWIIMIIINGGR